MGMTGAIRDGVTLAAVKQRALGSCMDESAVVSIIDDDASLRSAVDSLLRSVGLQVRAYGSVNEFFCR